MMQVSVDATQSTMSGEDATDAADVIDASETIDVAADAAETIHTIGAEENVDNTDDGYIHEVGDATVDLPVTEIVASDSSSSPAIADDLLNGCSQDTKVENELDAEMVSEDELPAPPPPVQPTDLSDLSDEELPGPKRAELPADTEVVSEEDEFSSTNKVKRKAEECPEADNPSEDVDTPKKRAKTEVDSKHQIIYFCCCFFLWFQLLSKCA